jgi:peptidylprolyl isomerase
VAPGSRRARALLAIGAAAGLALSAASLLTQGEEVVALPEGAVASVNGVAILREDYQRAVAALASDLRAPLAADDRTRVLDRLIEEELLVQHALSLGLARSDRRVRSDLVAAVLGSINASTDGTQPDPGEVERFYREERGYFASPGRLRVAQVFVAAEPRRAEAEAQARAQEAARRLHAGEPLESVKSQLGDEEIAPLPDAALPPAGLRSTLGPALLAAALELEVGASSDPLRSPQGYHVLQLREREATRTPPLAEIEEQVRAEIRRRAGDRALRERLDELRARGEVRVEQELP